MTIASPARTRVSAELISLEMLRTYKTKRGESVRTLAAKTLNPKTGRPFHASAVGHLLSGRAATCTLDFANAIEDALRVPRGSLFDTRNEAAA